MEVKNVLVQLEACRCGLLENIPDRSEPLDIHVSHQVEIQQLEGGTEAVYQLHTEVGPRPSSLFYLQIDQSIHVAFTEAVSLDQVREMAYDLASQGANALSLLIANLTRELIGTAIMVPPQLNQREFKVL